MPIMTFLRNSVDWSEESLRSHIENAHPHLASSGGAVHLLWRSFHFYAYHPFPRSSIEGKIDWEAFQRAVTMLAAQGADLLGVLEEIETFWRFDGEDLYNQAKLKRIFRSIGTPEKAPNLNDESRHILEETTDVLAMTQPFFMHNGPHEHQLTPTARRLLGENLIVTPHRVTQKDFETLLNILIRLNLFKENWGLSFPFGTFEPSEPGADELANILVSELQDGQGQEDQGFDRVNQIMYLLPNMYIQFYQMWAVIFQPVMANEPDVHARGPSHIPCSVLGSVSLFIPRPVVSTLREERGEDRRIALEDPILLSDDVTAAGVSDALSKDARSQILLVTGTDTTTSEPTAFGVYLPSKSEGIGLHLLFQLRPRFRLLRWSDPKESLMYIIDNADQALSTSIVASVQEAVNKNMHFCTGRPTKRNCITIHAGKKLAILMGLPRDVEDLDSSKQNGSSSDDMTQRGSVEATLGDITILRVSGSVSTAVSVLMKRNWTSIVPAGGPEIAEVRIQGEELRKRIVGFGSG